MIVVLRKVALPVGLQVRKPTCEPMGSGMLHLLAADRVMAPLGRARDWLVQHNGAVVALVLAVIGAKLLTVGLNALAG